MRLRTLGVFLVIGLLAAIAPGAALADDEGSELEGVVLSLPPSGSITPYHVSVSGVDVTVSVSATTEIEGTVTVGATVEATGTWNTVSTFTATSIEVGEGADEDDFGEIELQGVITALPAAPHIGVWTVGGKTVNVTAATELDAEDGPFAIGQTVVVEGLLEANGSITAHEIESNDEADDDSVVLTGTIQSVPGTSLVGNWRVSKQTVHVKSGTSIRNGSAAERGARVRVFGKWLRNSSFRAMKVVVRG